MLLRQDLPAEAVVIKALLCAEMRYSLPLNARALQLYNMGGFTNILQAAKLVHWANKSNHFRASCDLSALNATLQAQRLLLRAEIFLKWGLEGRTGDGKTVDGGLENGQQKMGDGTGFWFLLAAAKQLCRSRLRVAPQVTTKNFRALWGRFLRPTNDKHQIERQLRKNIIGLLNPEVTPTGRL